MPLFGKVQKGYIPVPEACHNLYSILQPSGEPPSDMEKLGSGESSSKTHTHNSDGFETRIDILAWLLLDLSSLNILNNMLENWKLCLRLIASKG